MQSTPRSHLGGCRVALDVTAAADYDGSGIYVSHLAAALELLVGREVIPVRFRWSPSLRDRSPVLDRFRTLGRDLWWHQFSLEREARRHGAALLHLPLGFGPIAADIPLVVTIHDLSVLHLPQYFRTWFRNYARWVLPRTARAARAVITVSETVKQELVREFDLPPERVTVIANGVGEEFRANGDGAGPGSDALRKYDLPEAFVLSVGTIEPRKNLVRLLEAVEQLRDRHGFANVHLVHAGPTGWLGTDVSRAVARFAPQHAIRFLGLVPRAELPVLYRTARLLAYPSLYEGFGLPVLEAMACGCPVVTSDRSSLPEVADGAAVLVDPTSVDAIAEGIARVWEDDTLRLDLARRGIARAAHFSWARCAAETVRVYERAVNSAP